MLINLRNALMAGMRLPYDAEVEFLESTGTQWIDTGIVATENTRVSARLMTISTGNKSWFGGNVVDKESSADGFAFNAMSVNAIEWLFGKSGWRTTTIQNIVGREFDVDFSRYGIIIDGQKVVTPPPTSFTQQTNPITVFVRVGGNAYINGRLYSFRIYVNNTLVRDYIPVRVGTVGYLYDRVTGRLFGNAGTGDFVLGPDVVPVEWLETTGVQYIDTGITCGSTDTTIFEFDQSYSALQSGRFIWGSNYGANQGKDADNYYVCGLNRSDVVMQTGVVYHCKTQVAPDNAIKAYINGTLFRDNTGSSPYTNPFYIFRLGGHNGGDGKPSYLRIYHLTVSINNALVRSFRPIRVGTDATSWEGAMMDVLTRRIYRNAGTGAFTYGNDLKYPIPAE